MGLLPKIEEENERSSPIQETPQHNTISTPERNSRNVTPLQVVECENLPNRQIQKLREHENGDSQANVDNCLFAARTELLKLPQVIKLKDDNIISGRYIKRTNNNITGPKSCSSQTSNISRRDASYLDNFLRPKLERKEFVPSCESGSSLHDMMRKFYQLYPEFDSFLDEYHQLSETVTNVRLEEHIKLPHLQQIMREFFQRTSYDDHVPRSVGDFSRKSKKRMLGSMTLTEFKDTIFKVVGTDEYNDYLEKLFIKLDTSGDGFVDWNEFSTHLLLLYRENDYLRTKNELPFVEEAKIRHIAHNRQEQTIKILTVHGPVRYLTMSKEGALTVWQPNMTVEKQYVIGDQGDEQKRRFKMWITDIIYMKNCQKLAIGSTGRDIRFYDVSTSQYFEEYHLFALADVPYCFDYHYNPKQPNSESLLVFGVDTGAIHLLTFLKPVTQLFQNPFKNDGGVQKVFMQDIGSHSSCVRHHVINDVHQEMIRQIRYLPENEAIISGSASPKSSVVICDLFGLKKSYVFRLEKGVECFDHNKNLNLLVTGSGDHIVRFWNPYVTNSPMAILSGHLTCVIGVVIHERHRQVFSYSKDTMIKVWDIKEHTCLQTVALKFPSSLHGRMPEHGQFPVHLQRYPRDTLLVTCNDYVAALRVGRKEEMTSHMEVTHETQLCCAIYNRVLKQVVTGCDSSTIATWDVESGNKSIVFPDAHEGEEITCLSLDASCRRLISGARNGTVKVWNFHNGQNLHQLENVGEAEVTGILHLPDQKVILTVGWNQMIVTYDNSNAENKNLPANTSWNGGQLHRDDILTVDFVPPNFLATASYDGEIILWEADTERVYLRLRRGQAPNISKQLEELKTYVPGAETRSRSRSRSAGNSRPNSRHRSSHKLEQGQAAPVDKLMFLKARAAFRFTESAVLLSSEAGVLRWWNIYTANREMGYFYAPSAQDESVLAMCTTPDDSMLITGDTLGTVNCWDIQKYCLKYEGYVTNTAPPVIRSWKAHDSAVVSVEYVEHDAGAFLLTASTDRTARLWSCDGHYIGTFGQRAPWNLKNPSTWAHPSTPWTVNEAMQATDEKEEKTAAATKDKAEEELTLEMNEQGMTNMKSNFVPRLEGREKSYISPIETFLGIKAEKDLVRRQQDRKGRRSHFGDISPLSTASFGSQCSPYHALTAPEWQDVELPTNLPLSQRMQNLGYTGNNLTADSIRTMDFSIGNTDSLPAAREVSNIRGLAPSRTRNLSSRHSTTSRHDREDRLPPVKSLNLNAKHGKLNKSFTAA